MGRRSLASLSALAAVIVIALLAPVPAAGQAAPSTAKASPGAKAWTPPHTADGKPDLQGIWTDNTLTPFERPKGLGSKEFYSDQELADLTTRVRDARPGERIEGAELGAANPGDPIRPRGVRVRSEQSQVYVQANLTRHRPGRRRASHAAAGESTQRRRCSNTQGA